MEFSDIWQSLLAGIIVGPLARAVVPGRQDLSLVMTVVLGAVGALVGDLVYGAIGGDVTTGIDWIRWVVRVAVGALAVVVYGMVRGRRTAT
ncbi:MAG: GlsB/YeaQ/YmgE family stress response membrane protein [Actinobacteria bacterium]|nr:GlsB/YeaQ/YmgE family stress response membrane protein [Actinomycetota bacterium]